MFEERDKAPELFSTTNFLIALAIHVLFFLICWWVVQPIKEKETIIPIDLTLVLNENLDGEDNKPPPVADPPKPKEPDKPKPPEPKKIEPPKPQAKVPDALVKEDVKTNNVAKVEKPKEKPKKKTTEERIKEMQELAKTVNNPPVKNKVKNVPSDNGRTGKKTLSDEEIREKLLKGYKPGVTEQIASSETQRCISLITRAFYEKWDDAPAWSPNYKPAKLKFNFDSHGNISGTPQLVNSSGDANVDNSIRRAASKVLRVNGLSTEFLTYVRKEGGVILTFEVKGAR